MPHAQTDPATRPPRPRGRPKQRPDELQREEIVAQAYALFREAGYGGATTEAVAARCRISKRTLYRLFPGKSALFAAVIGAHRQRMLDLPGNYDDLPLAAALDRIFRNDIDEAEDLERLTFLRLIMLEAVRHPELDEIAIAHGRDASIALLGDWLAHQHRLGRIDVQHPQDDARILMDMVFGPMVLHRGDDVVWAVGEPRRNHVKRCIHIFINGVARR